MRNLAIDVQRLLAISTACLRLVRTAGLEPARGCPLRILSSVGVQECQRLFQHLLFCGSRRINGLLALLECQKHGITERQAKAVKVSLGERYETFFEEFVAQESSLDVTRIVADFRSQTESRLKRLKTWSGEEMDIYKLVLLAISRKLPAASIAAGDITRQIDETVEGDPPETEAITRALQGLGTLAFEISEELKIGKPVLEYDGMLRRLHITDAFFAFHLKWGRD